MNRVLIALAMTGLIAAACGGAGTGAATTAPVAVATTAAPTTPAPTPTVQNQYVFTADLSPANVVPPITDAEASGSGTATVTIFTAKDTTGKIIGSNAKLEVTLKGFPATTIIVGLLAHTGAVGVNGGGVINSGITADAPVMLTAGAASITKDNLTITPDNAIALIANPAAFYVLAHSQVHASGVARGQLKLKT